MKKKFNEVKECVDGFLRRFCTRMTPKKRLITILILGALFTAINLYTILWTVYEIVRDDYQSEPTKIEHIRNFITPFNEKQNDNTDK